MGEPLRVGLIGCGNVVEYGHRPALNSLKTAGEVQLVALADITPARRELGAPGSACPHSIVSQTIMTSSRATMWKPSPLQCHSSFAAESCSTPSRKANTCSAKNPSPLCRPSRANWLLPRRMPGSALGMVHNYHYLPEYSALHGFLARDSSASYAY